MRSGDLTNREKTEEPDESNRRQTCGGTTSIFTRAHIPPSFFTSGISRKVRFAVRIFSSAGAAHVRSIDEMTLSRAYNTHTHNIRARAQTHRRAFPPPYLSGGEKSRKNARGRRMGFFERERVGGRNRQAIASVERRAPGLLCITSAGEFQFRLFQFKATCLLYIAHVSTSRSLIQTAGEEDFLIDYSLRPHCSSESKPFYSSSLSFLSLYE